MERDNCEGREGGSVGLGGVCGGQGRSRGEIIDRRGDCKRHKQS